MNRVAWVQRNAAISADLVAKAKKYNIVVIYCDGTSDNILAQITAIRAAGITPGLYFADSWWPSMAGPVFADRVSAMLNQFLPKKPGMVEAPPCMLDIEASTVAWQAMMLTRYRQHQPLRPTSYTDGAFMGGVTNWGALKLANMDYYAQVYYGDMRSADAAAVVLESCRYLGEPNRVHPFYAGEHYGADQRDGAYFTLERMP